MPAYFYLLLGIAAAIGFAVPPRAALWTFVATIALIALVWLRHDDSFHNDPWPILLTPPAFALIFGIAVRSAHDMIRRARRTGAGNE